LMIFPYFLRINKDMTSCGFDSKTLFLVDKSRIDAARIAARTQYKHLPPEDQNTESGLEAQMFHRELYRLLLKLKHGE
jgi:hypothetical protein